MGNKKTITPIVIAAMVAVAVVMVTLASFIMPASASGNPGAGCPSDTRFYDTIHGGVYFEQEGFALFKEMTQTFDVPSGTIKLNSHAYIQVSGKAVQAKADTSISPFRTPPAGLIPLLHTRHATPVLIQQVALRISLAAVMHLTHHPV